MSRKSTLAGGRAGTASGESNTRLNREMGLKLQLCALDAEFTATLAGILERLEPESRERLMRDSGFRASLREVDNARFMPTGLDLGAIHKRPPVASMLAAIA